MKRGVAIAAGASAILHVSVLLALDAVEPPKRPERKVLTVTVVDWKPAPVAEVMEYEPIEVAVVRIPAAETAVAATPTQERSFRSTSTSTSTPTSTITSTADPAVLSEGPGPESKDATGTGKPGRLSMRNLGAPDLAIGKQTFGLIDDPDAPPPWAPPEESGELDPSGGGTYRRHRPGFTGKVAADGKVSFKDKPAFSVKIKLPNPFKVAKRAAKGLEDYYRDPYKPVKEAERDWTSGLEVGDYTKHLDKHIDEDDKQDHGDVATIPILGGGTEITDWVMRKVGQDPYSSDKLLWMDQTRDERVQIGRVHRDKQLKRADEIMRRHLDHLWARTDMSLPQKREALFELWDDGAENGDRALVEAAGRARTLVIGFIRSRLPAGSPGAYTAAELDLLNRRRTSRARFVPYE